MNAHALRTALQTIAPIAFGANLPTLRAFVFGEGQVAANNMAVAAQHLLPGWELPIALDADTLLRWVATLPPDAEVHIQPDGTVSSGKAKFRVATIPLDDLPRWRVDTGGATRHAVPTAAFRSVLPFCPAKDHRAVLTGVNIRDNHIAATDGKRARRLPIEAPGLGTIMPRAMAEIIARADSVELQAAPSEIAAHMPSLTVRARPIEGRYPDIAAVLPRQCNGTIRVDAAALDAALARCSIDLPGNAIAPTATITPGTGAVVVASPHHATEALPAEVEGDPPALALGTALARLGIKAAGAKVVELRIVSDAAPVLFGPCEGEIVIMPVKKA